jgi:integrase
MGKQINPVNNNGSIRIRFTLKGKTYTFNPVPGGEYKNSDDMRAAKAIAVQIEGDIRTGNFDQTLAKYGHIQSIQKGIDQAQADLKELRDRQTGLKLVDLWERYAKFKKPLVAPSTFKVDFGRRMNWLRGTDYTTNDAIAVRDLLITTKPPKQARKILNHLAAACRWGIESGLMETNPFEGMAGNVPTLPTDEDTEINPFTPQEKGAVIAAFEAHPVYCCYAPLVRFLFATGCRPSEAIAIQWGDVKGDRLTFQRTYSEGEISPRLKTQKKRTIKLNQEAIAAIQSSKTNGDLVFPSPKGSLIDWNNFAVRAWRDVLKTLPEIGYRNPKQTRHTFITERVLMGDSPVNIARYCGNSPGTIYRNYLGASRDYSPG